MGEQGLEKLLFTASAIKRSSSGVRNRLKNHTGWVRRDICVDRNYIGWFTPWKVGVIAMPTGGVQTALIDTIEIEQGPHALGCPEKTVVIIRRLPSLSSSSFGRSTGQGKAWYFGFASPTEANKFVTVVRNETNLHFTQMVDNANQQNTTASTDMNVKNRERKKIVD